MLEKGHQFNGVALRFKDGTWTYDSLVVTKVLEGSKFAGKWVNFTEKTKSLGQAKKNKKPQQRLDQSTLEFGEQPLISPTESSTTPKVTGNVKIHRLYVLLEKEDRTN